MTKEVVFRPRSAKEFIRMGFLHFADIPEDKLEQELERYRIKNPFCYITNGLPINETEGCVGIYGIAWD